MGRVAMADPSRAPPPVRPTTSGVAQASVEARVTATPPASGSASTEQSSPRPAAYRGPFTRVRAWLRPEDHPFDDAWFEEESPMSFGPFATMGVRGAASFGPLPDSYGPSVTLYGELGFVLTPRLTLLIEGGMTEWSNHEPDTEPLRMYGFGFGARYYLARWWLFYPFAEFTVDGFVPNRSTRLASALPLLNPPSGTGAGVSVSAGLGLLFAIPWRKAIFAGARYDIALLEAYNDRRIGSLLSWNFGILFHI